MRPVNLNARDLAYLRALFIHGVLSSEMLHALVASERGQRATTDRIFLLKNPPNDYVVQPTAQENAKSANYTSLCYEISEKGAEALVNARVITFADFLLWKKLQANYKPQHFDHDFATGYILGSIALEAKQTGLRFIPWLEILSRQKCPAETREAQNPFALSYDANDGKRHLIPDALFGLEYSSGACFFALETDMGTEQQRDNELRNATIVRKLRGYRQLFRDDAFRTRFGLPSAQILTVTTSAVRMHNMLETLTRLGDVEARWPSKRFQFKAIPELDRRRRAHLPPTGQVLTEPWHRVQAPPCDISRL